MYLYRYTIFYNIIINEIKKAYKARHEYEAKIKELEDQINMLK